MFNNISVEIEPGQRPCPAFKENGIGAYPRVVNILRDNLLLKWSLANATP